MERIDLHPRIIKLLKHHHLLTVATSDKNQPWCASCFYAWNTSEQWLVITTDTNTRHGKEFLINNAVAGTVALETKRIGRIRGLQFEGIIYPASGEELTKARKDYLLRFPYAVVADLHLWIIRPKIIKLTDNRLGFGKKITWVNPEAL